MEKSENEGQAVLHSCFSLFTPYGLPLFTGSENAADGPPPSQGQAFSTFLGKETFYGAFSD